MKNSRKMLLLLALSLAVAAGVVRADSPALAARAAAPIVAQTPLAQAQVGQQSQSAQDQTAEQPEATEPAGPDNDAVQQGDQTGPDTPGVEDNTSGPDTDNVQEGDQSGPDNGPNDASEGPEDPTK